MLTNMLDIGLPNVSWRTAIKVTGMLYESASFDTGTTATVTDCNKRSSPPGKLEAPATMSSKIGEFMLSQWGVMEQYQHSNK